MKIKSGYPKVVGGSIEIPLVECCDKCGYTHEIKDHKLMKRCPKCSRKLEAWGLEVFEIDTENK